MSNQCQGCQAGWKLKKFSFSLDPYKRLRLHIVEGGYKGEYVGCTRHLYKKDSSKIEKA